MHKIIIPILAAGIAFGSLASMPAGAAGHVTSYVCGPGKHIGPNGKCREDTAPPILGGRKAPCPPGMQRTSVFGRCHPLCPAGTERKGFFGRCVPKK